MKTINKKRYKECNLETQKCKGFAGTVTLYDSNIYIDTRNGKGYDKVIEKFKPLIWKLALKYKFGDNTFEDTRHDIIVHILEGIPEYDIKRNTKLSTFIEMRVNKRLINELRSKNKISKNATFLNVEIHNITCECGHNFNVNLHDCDKCPECNQLVENACRKVLINIPEINETSLNFNGIYKDYLDNNLSTDWEEEKVLDDKIIFANDMQSWLYNEDPRVVKIIELVYFHDYSIQDAAKKVGLTGFGASLKLKKLSKKKIVRELFNR